MDLLLVLAVVLAQEEKVFVHSLQTKNEINLERNRLYDYGAFGYRYNLHCQLLVFSILCNLLNVIQCQTSDQIHDDDSHGKDENDEQNDGIRLPGVSVKDI